MNTTTPFFEAISIGILFTPAGVNNIPIDIASKKGVVVFNTPGANANAVKELVLCGLLLSSRGIIQGNSFAKSLAIDEVSEFNSRIENEKKNFKGSELASFKILFFILNS